ncbi:MAG TPA: sigma-54 dependent transcriptional regulator [Rhodocyclaceae bacterium]|nr:sigma-54 dependent transcriptional regulator [Rhodocyclaceae bacterium]
MPTSLLAGPFWELPADADQRGAFVFQDPRSLALLDSIRRIARADTCVLLIGESGTGQDLIARALHRASARATGPFRSANCGAYPPSQIESELFGYEKGAFAGAFSTLAGWLESADGGTLFVDEIERLPLHLQARLVEALREKRVQRVGGREARNADVRLIAATTRDLEGAVREGRFRADLYHVLRAAYLEVPALRERPGDILPMASHYAAAIAKRLNVPAARFCRDAEARLLAHAWPGNLRELENVMHRAMLMADEGEISAETLALTELQPGAPAAASVPDPQGSNFEALREVLKRLCASEPAGFYERIERELVHAAWQHCHLNQLRTARLLGISRNVLRARLIAWGDIDARR